MSKTQIDGFRVAGVSTCVPPSVERNLDPALGFDPVEVRKVVSMAGVRERRISAPSVTSADLCHQAAADLMQRLGWAPESVSALIFVTQTPDYFLPSSSCLLQHRLGLGDHCAAFDVGLGCSGYPYGLYLAATMLRSGGHQRILLLHGETPSHFIDPADHATRLLFSDAGSATALELGAGPASGGHFCLHSDGSGAEGLILRGGGFRNRHPANPRDHFLQMDGAGTFNFTIKRVPVLVQDTLALAGLHADDVDAFVFHQSNRFMIKHLAKKCGMPDHRVPLVLEDMGNAGGPSVALTMTRALTLPATGSLTCMLLGYGVGLSWASALIRLDANTVLLHDDHRGGAVA